MKIASAATAGRAQAPLTTNTQCLHGGYMLHNGHIASSHSFMTDIEFLRSEKGATASKKTKKKVISRLSKSVSRLSPTKRPEVGAATFVDLLRSTAVRYLLEGDIGGARAAFEGTLYVQAICWQTQTIDIEHSKNKAKMLQNWTTQGFLRHLNSSIPCQCLEKATKEAKKQGKVDICHGCKNVLAVKELFRCSHCKVVSYCSSACQLKHWKEHKQSCGRWGKELRREGGDTIE